MLVVEYDCYNGKLPTVEEWETALEAGYTRLVGEWRGVVRSPLVEVAEDGALP